MTPNKFSALNAIKLNLDEKFDIRNPYPAVIDLFEFPVDFNEVRYDTRYFTLEAGMRGDYDVDLSVGFLGDSLNWINAPLEIQYELSDAVAGLN